MRENPGGNSGEVEGDVASSIPHPLHTFIELFNAARYFDSHEALEGPWRTNGSAFYKGLILYASAFVHLQSGNAHGVRAQLAKAERELAPYAPGYLGVDVAGILAHAAAARDEVGGDTEGDTWTLRIRVPPIRLERRCLRGDETEAGAVA